MTTHPDAAPTSWLIERNSMFGCEWFCGGSKRFTNIAHKAIRFPDAESAAEIHSKLRGKVEIFTYPVVEDNASGEWEYTYTITEHMFDCGAGENNER